MYYGSINQLGGIVMRSPIRYAIYRTCKEMRRRNYQQHRRNNYRNKKQVEEVSVGDSLFSFFMGVGLFLLLIRIITL